MVRINPLRHVPADAPMCTSGKRPFRTEADALSALRRARWARFHNDEPGRIPGSRETGCFQCICGWYHLYGRPPHVRRSQHADRARKVR